jgi:exosortase
MSTTSAYEIDPRANYRHLAFAGLSILIVAAFHQTFATWLQLSLHNERYSHLCMIPLISGYMIYEIRHKVFRAMEFAPNGASGAVLCMGAVALGISHLWSAALDQISGLAITVFGVLVVCAGFFRICYGRHPWRAARFPMFFLLFIVPIPTVVLDRVIVLLQEGSAAAVDGLLTLLRFAYVRDGLRFEFAGLSIEIAEQCSGIRSSIALLIAIVLLAHYLLRTGWRRWLLVATTVPLVLFKNGLRIATLSFLAVRVDRRFITGSLHHDGGFVFFGLMLLVVGVLCWILRKSEVIGASKLERKQN